MKLELKLSMIFLMSVLLSACANELLAPCDQYATYCGIKTKINQ